MAVNVGNEALVSWTDHLVPVDSLISYVRKVKKAIKQPVTVAENYDWWVHHGSALASELDFISVHTYPLWEGKDIAEAMAFTMTNLQVVRNAVIERWSNGQTEDQINRLKKRAMFGRANTELLSAGLLPLGEIADHRVCGCPSKRQHDNHASVKAFRLARHDIPNRLLTPEKLHRRAREIERCSPPSIALSQTEHPNWS